MWTKILAKLDDFYRRFFSRAFLFMAAGIATALLTAGVLPEGSTWEKVALVIASIAGAFGFARETEKTKREALKK